MSPDAIGPYRKPDFITLKIVQPLLVALHAAPTLTVRGRSSGRPYTFLILPLEYEGRRYVIAPRGNTQWARNLRVASEAVLTVGRSKTRVRATEIPASERKPLVDAYVQQYGRKYGGYVAREFASMPDPADHPVFLLENL